MSRRYRTPQKTLPIAAVTKNAAIDLMYSGGPKMCRNRRHIAAVFATAAIGPPQLLVFLVVTVTVHICTVAVHLHNQVYILHIFTPTNVGLFLPKLCKICTFFYFRGLYMS